MKMMSANAMDVFINLIQKCYEQLVAPWKQNEPFSNPQCTIFVNIIHPLLDLTENLFKNMATTSFCFKDSRLVQQLFSLHKILCTKPPFGYLASVLTDIQEKIIAVLVLFMQEPKMHPSLKMVCDFTFSNEYYVDEYTGINLCLIYTLSSSTVY